MAEDRTGASEDRPAAKGSFMKGIGRGLGRFVGTLGKAATQPTQAPPAQSQPRVTEVGRDTQEVEGVDAAGRRVIMRRTTIDEVEIANDPPASGSTPKSEPKREPEENHDA